ncbi:MAG: hypothetical protein HYX52_02680 [Chloroflexi bacterium]|nr:hypothetical protein [Chloroflexota bacterium]
MSDFTGIPPVSRDVEIVLEDDLAPVGPTPTLDDLGAESRDRIVRFIIANTLGGGVAPTAVIALYADLAGDPPAIRYADQRFMLRQIPPDWREVEEHVVDLDETARGRGMDLGSAWRRATAVAVGSEDPLEHLARLAGAHRTGSRSGRSIFDDPEDLDGLDDDMDATLHARLEARQPDLVDLDDLAQGRIRRYAIEEQLEHGLPPYELIELYRGFDESGDERARQYLDRVFVEHEAPYDWDELQKEARRVMAAAQSRGRDAGRLFATIVGTSPGTDALVALHVVMERLQL